MVRMMPSRGAQLEALLDERDHLLVRLSLEDNSGHGDPDALKEMRLKLALLAHEIDDHWSARASARRRVAQRAAAMPPPSKIETPG